MKPFNNFTKYLLSFLCCFSLLIGIAASVLSEETYVFERMWPTLQQPWYFVFPYGIAVDSSGYIYIADSMNYRIQKFTSNGEFISTWGSNGSGDGQFRLPTGIAIEPNGFIYVIDSMNHRIQKFTLNGEFILKWGSYGSEDGQFDFDWNTGFLGGIDVDSSGNVYVADTKNHRIQKFASNGEFILKWGSQGSGDGQFSFPEGIAVDSGGYIYITDRYNHRIQKFTSNGEFISTWGSYGSGDMQFNRPTGIIIDSNENIYVADSGNHRIKKFTSNWDLITTWGQGGHGNGAFSWPRRMAIDSNGYIFISDRDNDRIQKFTSNGEFVSKWGCPGSEEGMFNTPHGITMDTSENIYVVDNYNHRIQKFSSDGDFITQFGSEGSGDVEFHYPTGIAIDSSGNIYVSDGGLNSILKFSGDGTYITEWGSEGSGDGEFKLPYGIAIDANGHIYVVDKENNRVQKFKLKNDGSGEYEFVTKWGSVGNGDGEFNRPSGIAVDSNGFIYVTDTDNYRVQKFRLKNDGSGEYEFVTKLESVGSQDGMFLSPIGIAVDNNNDVYVVEYNNDRVQKFSSTGEFITKFGVFGFEPGQFNQPIDLCVCTSGKIYVSDSFNDRVQIFKKVEIEDKTKAIIVAGGGQFSGNNLWDATQLNANFAYRTLTYQGFTKSSIYYLTSDTDLDLDGNGEADDVDADATNANLQEAITTWASDAENLVVYLVDHGGEGTFRMSGTETLSASDLGSWLDQLQDTIAGKVTVIYDACESGSFLSELTPPSGVDRTVITSTSPGESAYFVSQGSVSFSNYFWTHIFNGLDIKDSFTLAKEAIGQISDYQTPLLDANGDGAGNETEDLTFAEGAYIGNGTIIYGDVPVIGSVSDLQTINGTSSATLSAINVTDDDGIARVWAVIRPPDYSQGSSDNPVQSLPSIELMPAGEDQYEGTYDGFNIEGSYSIAIYARDSIGNTAVPLLTTVNVENALSRRAIIVVGGSQSDDIWPAIENNATLVYEALTFQGYTDNDIYFMSPVTFSAGVDWTATLSNLEYAINTWAQQSTQDLVLYMIGNGGYETFELNVSETLSASQLDSWLDMLQGNISGKVTVIYEACQSGSFLPLLTPPEDKERIIISSTSNDQTAYFLSEGDISFSRFFWVRILNGMNVKDAFVHAKDAIYLSALQLPLLDDNGNGIGNEKQDGLLSRDYSIGVGIMLAGDDPVIGSVSSNQTLSGTSSATIWADDVTTTGTIDRVWAVITPPGYLINVAGRPVIDLPIVELVDNGNGLYEGTYSDFNIYGFYNIAVYAKDADGNISIPSETKVFQEEGLGAWNMISLEKQPENANIEAVLESISDKVISVWAYINGSWKVYDPENPGLSDLTTMEAGIGYWINIIEAGTLTVSGTAPSKSIEISSGWNLVGYNSETSQDIADALSSIEGKYISVWAYIGGSWKVYDPENPGFSDLTIMEPGYGYWINASEACTWTLP